MKSIKFKKAGQWADPNPSLPQVSAIVGDTKSVSDELAKQIVKAGHGEIVVTEAEKIVQVQKEARAEVQRAEADKIRAQYEINGAKNKTAKAKAEKDLAQADKRLANAKETAAELDKLNAET